MCYYFTPVQLSNAPSYTHHARGATEASCCGSRQIVGMQRQSPEKPNQVCAQAPT